MQIERIIIKMSLSSIRPIHYLASIRYSANMQTHASKHTQINRNKLFRFFCVVFSRPAKTTPLNRRQQAQYTSRIYIATTSPVNKWHDVILNVVGCLLLILSACSRLFTWICVIPNKVCFLITSHARTATCQCNGLLLCIFNKLLSPVADILVLITLASKIIVEFYRSFKQIHCMNISILMCLIFVHQSNQSHFHRPNSILTQTNRWRTATLRPAREHRSPTERPATEREQRSAPMPMTLRPPLTSAER